MKVAAFSDSHNYHHMLTIPEVDLLVSAGDWTNWGGLGEIQNFLDWVAVQPVKYKVITAGNHDIAADEQRPLVKLMCKERGIHILYDEMIKLEDKRIYGSPRTPEYGSYAFMYDRAEMGIWKDLPKKLDLLITHGPPMGVLDDTRGIHAGCHDLMVAVAEKKPRFHVFGHIHQGHGALEKDTTQFYNVAVFNPQLGLCHTPTLFEI